MTIEKAIENLSEHTHYAYQVKDPDLLNALKLGIEALKRLQDVRRFPDASNWKPLPGETKD